MRIVVDTNVLLAAVLTHGASAEVLEHCLIHHRVYLSAFILKEVEQKLLLKFQFPKKKVMGFLRFLRRTTQKVNAVTLSSPVCRDTDDDYILATGVTAKADCILTGDSDLLELIAYEGIRILRPADFWKFEKEYAPSG